MNIHWRLPFRLLNNSVGFITGDGSWRLTKFELDVIGAAAATLSPEDQAILQYQLAQRFYVQRQHSCRMSDIHPYFPEKWPKMNHPREFCMAKLVVISKVSHMRVTVETYEGMIRAVRCQKPPGLIITEPYQIKISTTGGPITDNIATELNAMEHPEER